MKKKGYAKGGAMKKKGYAKGGAMKKKPIAMKKGSKLRMVEKDGNKVPFFAADGVGKMKDGGVPKPKKKPAAMVKPKPRPSSETAKSKTKKGARAGSPKKMDLKTNKEYGYLRDEKGIMPRINRSTGEREYPMNLRNAAFQKTAAKKKDKLLKDTMSKIEQANADSRRNKRKKSGQLDQAKKKARKTAVKAMGGGMMKKKGYAKGGVVKKMRGGMMKKKGYAKGGSVARGSGAARPQRFTRNG